MIMMSSNNLRESPTKGVRDDITPPSPLDLGNPHAPPQPSGPPVAGPVAPHLAEGVREPEEPVPVHDGGFTPEQGEVGLPLRYRQEPPVPRRGVEDARALYSIKFQYRNGTHFRVEVLISVILLRSVAYCGIVGAALVVVVGICGGPIANAAALSAGLRGLRSFVVESASIDTLGTIAYVLLLAHLAYRLVQEGRAAAEVEDPQD